MATKIVYGIESKPPLGKSIVLALQHILAMFASNVAVPIIVAGAIGEGEEIAFLVQCALFAAGVATLLQTIKVGRVGAKLPIVMGTSFGFLPTCIVIGGKFGLPGLFGAAIVGGVFEIILGVFIKPLRKYFPPIVTGVVLLTIGLSLLPTGIAYFGGGNGAADFGAPHHWLVGSIVLITVVALNQFGKGFVKISAILVGIIVGYIVSIPLGLIDFTAVKEAAWIGFPMPFKYGIKFYPEAILTIMVIYLITAVETVGDISGITVGGEDREPTDEELSGGVIADGTASIIAAVFNAMPNTSFSQNVGVISFTKVMSTYVVKIGAIFLLIASLCPKLATLISTMPSSVLGGATIVMFGSIAVTGMRLITSQKLGDREVLIVAVALCMGLGISQVPDILNIFPDVIKNIFGGSGIVVAFLITLILNLVLPKEEEKSEVKYNLPKQEKM